MSILTRLIDVLVNPVNQQQKSDDSTKQVIQEEEEKPDVPTQSSGSSPNVLKNELNELRKKLDETKSSFMTSKQDISQLLAEFIRLEPERREKFYECIVECLQQGRCPNEDSSPVNEAAVDDVDR